MIKRIVFFRICFTLIFISFFGCAVTSVATSSGNDTISTYTVTFDSQGATIEASPAIIIITNPTTNVGTLPIPPSKNGYDFAGWITTTNGGGAAFMSNTTVTANITVYAMWSSTNLTFQLINGDNEYCVLSASGGVSGNVIIPEKWSNKTVTTLGYRAFYWNTLLDSLTIPSSVTFIDNESFYGCSGLTSITIPNGVTTIGSFLFTLCSHLTNIILPSNLMSIKNSAFFQCSGLSNLILPNSVTNIGMNVFYGCSGLTNMIIPGGISAIGDYAFYGCTGLKNLSMDSMNAPTIGLLTFGNVSNCILHIHAVATGYTNEPWANTTIFYSIVTDL